MYGIYCTKARGRQPRGLSAIYAMQPECTCYNYNKSFIIGKALQFDANNFQLSMRLK